MQVFVRAAEDPKVVSQKENLINEADSGVAAAAAAAEKPEPAMVPAQECGSVANDGWDIELWAQHFVLSPLLKQQLKGWTAESPADKKSFYCDLCKVIVTNWMDVAAHVGGTKTSTRDGER